MYISVGLLRMIGRDNSKHLNLYTVPFASLGQAQDFPRILSLEPLLQNLSILINIALPVYRIA
jgi:hypothetical protein